MFLFCAITVLTQAPAKRALTVDDLFAIKQVGTPQVSPTPLGGLHRALDHPQGDRNETELWMAPLDSSGAAIPLTGPGLAPSDARWSPDGKYLSFLATRPRGPGAAADSGGEPKTQVWALDRRGGEARPLTHVAQGVDAYEWSPDGSRLVLAIQDTLARRGRARARAPRFITRLQFKQDGTGYLDTLRTPLYVLTLASGALTQVTSGNHDEGDATWSPDGKWIAFVSQSHSRARWQPQRRHSGSSPPTTRRAAATCAR